MYVGALQMCVCVCDLVHLHLPGLFLVPLSLSPPFLSLRLFRLIWVSVLCCCVQCTIVCFAMLAGGVCYFGPMSSMRSFALQCMPLASCISPICHLSLRHLFSLLACGNTGRRFWGNWVPPVFENHKERKRTNNHGLNFVIKFVFVLHEEQASLNHCRWGLIWLNQTGSASVCVVSSLCQLVNLSLTETTKWRNINSSSDLIYIINYYK